MHGTVCRYRLIHLLQPAPLSRTLQSSGYRLMNPPMREKTKLHILQLLYYINIAIANKLIAVGS